LLQRPISTSGTFLILDLLKKITPQPLCNTLSFIKFVLFPFQKPDDYENYTAYVSGFAKRLYLKKDAIPSIFPGKGEESKSPSRALIKLDGARVCFN